MPTFTTTGFGTPTKSSGSGFMSSLMGLQSPDLTNANNNWNQLYNPSAYVAPNANPAGSPPPTIGTWPPSGYNSGAGIPRPRFDSNGNYSPTGNFDESGNHIGTGGGTTGGTTGGASLTTPYGGGPLSPAIAGLITPGLVPDIARMSAETAGGRGVGGSPAGASTAVKMSEADYLQRLGLANTLLSGEAGRALPYQITPLQSAELANRIAVANIAHPYYHLQTTGFPGYGARSGSGYGGGNFTAPSASPYTGGYTGYGQPSHGAQPGVTYGGGGYGSDTSGLDNLNEWFGWDAPGSSNASPTLADMYEWFGWGAPGTTPGSGMDTGDPNQPPDFDWEMWE